MTGKDFFVLFLTFIGLPVIIPVMLLKFWIKCAMNVSDNMYALLIDTVDVDTEPDYVVEAIDDFKKKAAEAAKKDKDEASNNSLLMSCDI